MNIQATGQDAQLPVPFQDFKQAVEAHPLLHVTFPGGLLFMNKQL
jgi:hypothetical protein